MRRALVVGASGYVGRRLVDHLGPERGTGTFNSHPIDGMLPFDAVRSRLADLPLPLGEFSHVFIPFGIVNPEACASDPDGTAVTNVASVQRLVEDAQSAGLCPVFLSTDYVFDGTRGLRREDEPTCPTTEYGRQKAAVETWMRDRPGPWLIARLSKVVGAETDTHSVLGQWVNDIRAGAAMRSATDQVFSPAHVDDIAGALLHLAETGQSGIWHVAGAPCSRYELNRLLADAVHDLDRRVSAQVQPCSLREIPFRELRPLNTSLSTDRLAAVLPWRFKTMPEVARDVARQHFGPSP